MIVRLNVPPLFFTLIGVVLLAAMTIAITDTNLDISNSIENTAWFMLGLVSFCVIMQIVMRFFPECNCDVKGGLDE